MIKIFEPSVDSLRQLHTRFDQLLLRFGDQDQVLVNLMNYVATQAGLRPILIIFSKNKNDWFCTRKTAHNRERLHILNNFKDC